VALAILAGTAVAIASSSIPARRTIHGTGRVSFQ